MMKIAILRERRPHEKRVAASPDCVKKYIDLNPLITEALVAYKDEVESGSFPTDEQTY